MPFKDPEKRKAHNKEYYAEYRLRKAAEIKERQTKWFLAKQTELQARRVQNYHAVRAPMYMRVIKFIESQLHPYPAATDTDRILIAGEKWASLTTRKRAAIQEPRPRWSEAFARLLRVGEHTLHPDLYMLAGASANRQGCRAAVCLGSLSIEDQYHYLAKGLPLAAYQQDKPVILTVSVYEMSEAQRRQIFQRTDPFIYVVRDVAKQRQWLRKHKV